MRENLDIEPVEELPTLDPRENLSREETYLARSGHPRCRVWRNSECLVLGRFLEPVKEVFLDRARRLNVPVLKRQSGGGAVYHDRGNINYSLYLPDGSLAPVDDSLRALSYPITDLLDMLKISWTWDPPNNVCVDGKKISGSAQARSRGRVLHHGTLLVETDLERMMFLLRPGGRSKISPVVNLANVLPGITVGKAVELMYQAMLQPLRGQARPVDRQPLSLKQRC